MRLLRSNKRMLVLYVLAVILPLVIIIMYMTLFAKDRYVSESVVMVKQVGEVSVDSSGGLGALLGVNNTSAEDAQILKQYVTSRDMVEKLDAKFNLRAAFSGSKDVIFHLKKDASIEELIEYFNERVDVSLDEKTMMLKVSTQGFEPQFALLLNQEILKNSELFINDISKKIAQEQLSFSEKQLDDSMKSLKQARDELLKYQNNNQMFDPQAQAQAVAQIVVSLESSLAQLKTEERMLLSYLNPEAAQVVAIRSQIEALKKQITDEKAKLTSGNSNKLNKSVADFEALKAEVEFQTDLYKLSLASLEKARLEASRKLKNLVTISTPRLSQDAIYPRRVYICFTSFILLNILFGIGALIFSVIREHKE